MTFTYMCSLPLPDTWFAELQRRHPDIEIIRVDPERGATADELRRVHLLHTSAWLPEAADLDELRAVQLDTSGADHLRGTSLWDSGVPVATLGGIAPVPMAEYAMMAVLELAHRMPRVRRLNEERRWPSDEERLARLTPVQIDGARMGIIGYGRIGREISRLARAFGMRVTGVSRSGRRRDAAQFDKGRELGDDPTPLVSFENIDGVIAESDVLVVVVPLTELSRGMLDARRLGLLPEGALLVNIARGGIVDEAALLQRLRDGLLGGVVLDVFDDEPLPDDSPWWNEPGVLTTPHVAGLAPLYLDHTLDLVAENVQRLIEQQPILNEVNRDAGY